MKGFQLSGEQIAKLEELVKAISLHYKLKVTYYDASFLTGHKKFTWWYVTNGKDEVIGWFEFCFTEGARFVVERYAAQVRQSQSWAHRLIMQKLGHDLPQTNPIDTLYELWKKPDTYVEGL